MIVTCRANRVEQIPEWLRNEAEDVEYPLRVGAKYPVLGALFHMAQLTILVPDEDDGLPVIAPFAFFESDLQPCGGGWRLQLFDGLRATGEAAWLQPMGAVWGYRELVDKVDHVDDLQEYRREDLQIFFERTAEALVSAGGGQGDVVEARSSISLKCSVDREGDLPHNQPVLYAHVGFSDFSISRGQLLDISALVLIESALYGMVHNRGGAVYVPLSAFETGRFDFPSDWALHIYERNSEGPVGGRVMPDASWHGPGVQMVGYVQ